MTGRITQLGLSRWTAKGGSYRTIHRFFQENIDWDEILWQFVLKYHYNPDETYILAADETVISKSGKETFGIDRFFSSIAKRPIPGISCFGIALVSVTQSQAFLLSAHQTVRTEEEKKQTKQKKAAKKDKAAPNGKRGRPKGSKNKSNADVKLSAELERIKTQISELLNRIGGKIPLRYLALDGHFGNLPACQMVRGLGLHIVTKLRHTSALYFEPTVEEKQKRPRLKYGVRVDYACLPEGCLQSSAVENGYRLDVYQAICLHKDFRDKLNVVILVKTDIETKRVSHVVLVCSDLVLSSEALINYYSLRFQIEFEFRDAKQHFGLEDFMGVSEHAVKNGMNLPFFMSNLSAYLLRDFRKDHPDAGILDLKSWFRGRYYGSRVIKMLPERPDGITCEEILSVLSRIGSVHSFQNQPIREKQAA